jgi:hypothetical protein
MGRILASRLCAKFIRFIVCHHKTSQWAQCRIFRIFARKEAKETKRKRLLFFTTSRLYVKFIRFIVCHHKTSQWDTMPDLPDFLHAKKQRKQNAKDSYSLQLRPLREIYSLYRLPP